MIERVRWPGPPLRLASVVGWMGWTMRVLSPLLWSMGVSVILFALVLATGWAEPLLGVSIEDEAFAPIWIPIVLAAIGAFCLWLGWRSWQFANEWVGMARHPEQLRLADADLLGLRHGHRGVVIWTYAYTCRGHRFFRRQPMWLDPMMLDDVGSRGAAVVMPDGSSILLGPTAHPLAMEKAVRQRLLDDVAALAARRTSPSGRDLPALEGRLDGARREFVRLYREACCEADPERRRELVRQRLRAAFELDPEQIDRLLRDCRRQAAGAP